MKFKKFSLQKKLYISCLLLDFILLLVCCLVFYHYTTDSLKRNMQDTLIGNTSLLSNELDSLIKTADNSLKELQTDNTLMSTAKKITDSPSNYFLHNVSDKYAFQTAFQSLLISQGIDGSISYVSRYYDEVGVSYSSGPTALSGNPSYRSWKN